MEYGAWPHDFALLFGPNCRLIVGEFSVVVDEIEPIWGERFNMLIASFWFYLLASGVADQ